MQRDWDQVAIAGFVLFVAGAVWTVRYTLRALAMPHTYTGALLIGGAVTLVGAVTAAVGVMGRLRRR
ncbi:MAG: hypothetical protein HOV87_33710 [Catenulispora sp.]|nr:hypothetical protein [Catenulispora sp.]